MSLGKNHPCWCGSGRKYKKCHMAKDRREQTLRRAVRAAGPARDLFGLGRPPIAATVQGHPVVAVGSEVHWPLEGKGWRTKPDFLVDYVKRRIWAHDRGWFKRNEGAAAGDRHPLYEIALRHLVRWNSTAFDANGLRCAVPSGPMLSWLTFAYDLETLQHNVGLQARLLDRILVAEQFQGARYELAVAAMMIRAGFHIDFLDESGRSGSTPEFVATHLQTRVELAIEAKSRRRQGVLGSHSGPDPEGDLAVDSLLSSAFEKPTQLPLVVFVDVNLPPSVPPGWFSAFEAAVSDYRSTYELTHDPWTILVGTNHPFHYGADDADAPHTELRIVCSEQPAKPLGPAIAEAIAHSAERYAILPNDLNE